jgi:hypothetical protein
MLKRTADGYNEQIPLTSELTLFVKRDDHDGGTAGLLRKI